MIDTMVFLQPLYTTQYIIDTVKVQRKIEIRSVSICNFLLFASVSERNLRLCERKTIDSWENYRVLLYEL